VLGFHLISFHLTGTLYGTTDAVTPAEVPIWAATILRIRCGPYAVLRRRYSSTQLNLRSTNRRHDLLVILAILTIEAVAELVGLSSAIFGLSAARRLALGLPLTFVVYFIGTVLPTMVIIQ
jgi:hypothetical protein